MSDPIIDSTLAPDSTPTVPLDIPAEAVPSESTVPQITPGEETFPLPSGVTCVMRRGKGRDLLAAQRMAGGDQHQIMYALLASLCTFDGAKCVMEDVLDMPLPDVMRLTSKFSDLYGGDFLPPTPGPSSTSPQ